MHDHDFDTEIHVDCCAIDSPLAGSPDLLIDGSPSLYDRLGMRTTWPSRAHPLSSIARKEKRHVAS
ncbi:MAG: hypothetical protein KDI69_10700 [Xanthomonadales bacterium]|nr:hypothetical protein [Xanthomonadales bacterium]